MSEPVFRLWLFGDVRAECGGAPVRIAVRPLCAVLTAMLALRPGSRLTRKQLATDLWPDESDATRANGNLRRHLSALQSALPTLPGDTPWIEAHGATLAWSATLPIWCDAQEFEEALSDPGAEPDAFAAAGEFMPGYANDWVLAQRENYRARAVERLLTMCVERQDDDRIEAALACAEAALRLDPLREDAVQLALELHGERGDPIAAGALFATFAERLRREVDASPATATVALIERIRTAVGTRRERLPRAATTFLGRGEAVEAVANALEQHRCVTIVGAGGLGKTRLSLETATRLAHRFADGSYFVDLSTLPPGSDVADTAVRALELPSELASAGAEGVKRFFRNRRAFVILDNCEHVLESCAAFAHDLLNAAPRLTILATSRIALGIQAENVFRLTSLSENEARALFIERTRSAGITRSLSSQELSRVDNVCATLDRSPLAIELAAGLGANLGIADIERCLPERFALLRTNDPSMPQRHRALEAAIAWSFELLSPSEQRLFECLAVFVGSFTFEAVLAVTRDSKRTFIGLVEKSMVQRDETNADRYRLLFSLAQFAQERFAVNPEADVVRRRHADYFAALATQPDRTEHPRGRARWTKAVELELPDVRAALHFLLAGPGDAVSAGVEAVLALAPFFKTRGYFDEGLAWIAAAQPLMAQGSQEYARARFWTGEFMMIQRKFPEAHAATSEALALFRALSSEADVARALAELGAISISMRDFEAARRLLDEGLPLAQRTGLAVTQAVILANLGVLAWGADDIPLAIEFATEAARLCKAAGDRRFLAHVLDDLAAAEFLAGRHGAAIDLLNEALGIAQGLGDVPLIASLRSDLGDVLLAAGSVAEAREHFARSLEDAAALDLGYTIQHSLMGLAGVSIARGDALLAARLLGAGAAAAEASIVTRVNESLFLRTKAAVIERIGERDFERELQMGELLHLEDAIALAHASIRSPAGSA
jgi:predicted ATPase/DNA-binding SARP family transcriptional activator